MPIIPAQSMPWRGTLRIRVFLPVRGMIGRLGCKKTSSTFTTRTTLLMRRCVDGLLPRRDEDRNLHLGWTALMEGLRITTTWSGKHGGGAMGCLAFFWWSGMASYLLYSAGV